MSSIEALNGGTVSQMPGFGFDWLLHHPPTFRSCPYLSGWKPLHSGAPRLCAQLCVVTQNARNLLCTTQDKASIIEDGVNLGRVGIFGHIVIHKSNSRVFMSQHFCACASAGCTLRTGTSAHARESCWVIQFIYRLLFFIRTPRRLMRPFV